MTLSRRAFLAVQGAAAGAVLVPGRLLAASRPPPRPPPRSTTGPRSVASSASPPTTSTSRASSSPPTPPRFATPSTPGARPWTRTRSWLSTAACSRTRRGTSRAGSARPPRLPRRKTGGGLPHPEHHHQPRARLPRASAQARPGDPHHPSRPQLAPRRHRVRGPAHRRDVPEDFPVRRSGEGHRRRNCGRIRAGVKPATRVVGITWVHSQPGIRLPIRAISGALAELNKKRDSQDHILLVVDGVHGLGCTDENVADMGADYFCAGTHKWIFAPRGTGLSGRAPRPGSPPAPHPHLLGGGGLRRLDPGPSGRAPPTPRRTSPGGFLAYEHQWATSPPSSRTVHGPRPLADARHRAQRPPQGRPRRHSRRPAPRPREAPSPPASAVFEVEGKKPEDVVKALLTQESHRQHQSLREHLRPALRRHLRRRGDGTLRTSIA